MTITGEEESLNIGLPNAGRYRQIACSVMITLATLFAGLVQGWLSPMTAKLRADDSPVGPMSKDDLSLAASVPSYMGLITGVTTAIVANRWGRKYALVLVGTAGVIGGFIVTFANSTILLIIGRCVVGISGTAVMVAPMIISETIHTSLRGMMMALCSFQINTGILLAYVFGKILSYRVFNLAVTVIPAIIALLGLWLPETPHFLVSKKRTKDAMKSLVWWRGGNREVARQELATIKPPSEVKVNFTEAFKTRQSKIAFIVAIGGFFFQTLSGIHIFIQYNSLIFDDIGKGPFSPDDSSIIIAVMITLATFANSALIEIAGRRPLLLLSFFASSISLGALTIYVVVLKSGADVHSLTWIPLACIAVFVGAYGLGTAVVPSVLMNELCPTDLKPTLSACVGFAAFGTVIFVLQTFVYIEEHIGLYMCFLIPTVANLLGTIFSWIFVPETKGKTLTQIANELNRVTDDEES